MSKNPETLKINQGVFVCFHEDTDENYIVADPNITKEGVVFLHIFKNDDFVGETLYGPEQKKDFSLEDFMLQTYNLYFPTGSTIPTE